MHVVRPADRSWKNATCRTVAWLTDADCRSDGRNATILQRLDTRPQRGGPSTIHAAKREASFALRRSAAAPRRRSGRRAEALSASLGPVPEARSLTLARRGATRARALESAGYASVYTLVQSRDRDDVERATQAARHRPEPLASRRHRSVYVCSYAAGARPSDSRILGSSARARRLTARTPTMQPGGT